MSFSSFINVAKESNYNVIEVFKQAPNESMVFTAILLVIIFAIYFFINKEVKTNKAIKLVDKLQDCKSYDEFNEKLSTIVQELPKRGLKVADVLNTCKEHILFRSCKLLEGLSIEDKINKYQEMSKNYEELAKGSKKYENKDLTKFYEDKAKELLDEDLASEIKYYYENAYFDVNEVSNVNAIVKYANEQKATNTLILPMLAIMDKFSFAYNLDLYKFVEKLDEINSKEVFKFCNEKIESLFENAQEEISINILNYLLEKQENEKVYAYISNLKYQAYLQQLHDLLFNKKDSLDLDLSFIANPLEITNEYKNYIDVSLTNNWQDKAHVDYVSKAPGVLDILGHMEFRTLIERIDNIAIQEENTRKMDEALAIAKRAEIIALEAKSLSKKPIILPSTTKA